MQWLTNLPLGDNRALQIAVIAGIVIVAITALIIAYRALFGESPSVSLSRSPAGPSKPGNRPIDLPAA